MTNEYDFYAMRLIRTWNSHCLEDVLQFYSPEFIGRESGQVGLQQGREAMQKTLEQYWVAFPDLTFTLINTLVEAPCIAMVWSAEGTHRGSILNIPPTGQHICVSGMTIIQVENGSVVCSRTIWDMAGMLREIGLLPELSTQFSFAEH
jgi:steroid delta-isomerase-like uncharacterized protein